MIKPEQWQRNFPTYYSLINQHKQYIADLMRDNDDWLISMGVDSKRLGYHKDPPFAEAEAALAEHFDELITWCDAYRALVFPK